MAAQSKAEQTPEVVNNQPAELSGGAAAANGIKLAGEALVAPGASLILDGNVVLGGAHFVGGLLAKSLLGPMGLFLVAANSYSKSVTGQHLTEHLKFNKKEAAETAEAAAS